ncbi:MAG: DUF72 domain-containing protein [Anaerolineae bacterium]|nr:DUF72 domain-containing protein [Anaerolineae bacterium]MDW8102062.1 DUF72 domain-containing protein [Anaerolineae bacterium]
MAFWVGTSGWVYPHWKGVLYPPELPQREWLGFYSSRFRTVEINSTFYRLPSEESFKSWNKATPSDFLFSVKASRFITHIKKLKVSSRPVEVFLERARLLGPKLGPILFQLPPDWTCNLGRFEAFLELLPGDLTFAFEFRNESWFNEKVYSLLEKKGIALCLISLPGFLCPVKVTAPFVYIRMHGSGVVYGGLYGPEELNYWARLAKNFLLEGLDLYVYFNNDAFGFAVRNAAEFAEMLI